VCNRGLNIQYIKRPTKKVKEMAMIQDGRVIKLLSPQSEDLFMLAVKEYGMNIMWIPKKNQTPKVCLAAVKNSGISIRYIAKNKITEELALAAIKTDCSAFLYLPASFQSNYKFCLKAVKINGLVLSEIKSQTEEICSIALKQNGLALEYVENKTLDLCIKALKSKCPKYSYLYVNIVPNPDHPETLKNLLIRKNITNKMNKAFSKQAKQSA
jgi:hypothetical protein